MNTTRLARLAVGFALALACRATPPPVLAPPVPTKPSPVAPAPETTGPSLTPGEAGIERHFAPAVASCGRGDMAACTRLAQRVNTPTNDREARRLNAGLAAGCTAGVRIACAGEAMGLLSGFGGTPDPARGLARLQQLCKEGDGFACGQVAEVYIAGRFGVSGKEEEGRRLAARTCDQQGGWACLSAAAAVAGGEPTPAVLPLLQRGCDGGDPTGCYQLGMIYAEGERKLVDKDPVRATALYKRGCDLDLAPSCFNLAWQHLRGTGAPKDERLGADLLDRACTLGDASGCDELARRNAAPGPYCERWGAEACYDLAAQISKTRGETADTAAEILRAGERACMRGHSGACRVLRHLAKDHVRLCTAGERVKDTCTFAGMVHDREAAAPDASKEERADDLAKAKAAFNRACEAGSKPACDAQARLPH